ncbi:MAG: HEAT repeat domain-containing protein [Verrucomicrobia bacterium]|nr:HEAT repeat domain-containing protein [Verrucomicrobiota bacterium]MBS0645587.1 HEAT repeat domain-containing protein [Verrucomicrobiota bacterium]
MTMIPVLLTCALLADFSDDLKRIQAHLKVGDEAVAVLEARKIVENYPSEPVSYVTYITALAQSGDLTQMLEVWDMFAKLYPEQAHQQRVLEAMCWGILRQGRGSSTLSTRLLSIIGATLTQDAYALDFLLSGLRDSNTAIRALSVELASLLGDRPLKDEILHLLAHEKKQEVRLEVLRAVAKLRLSEAYEELLRIVESKHTSAEERALAISAILEISQHINAQQLHRLASDPRAALRLIAAEMIAKFEEHDQVDLLIKLSQDPQPEVAAAALRTIGLLRIPRFQNKSMVEYLRPLTKTSDSLVGITASWGILLHDEQEGIEVFQHWIMHEKEDVRAMAAAAVAAAGPYGVQAALKFLKMTHDPYVQINLAKVLVGQRVNCEEACQIINNFLLNHQEKWMEAENVFAPLTRSHLSHRPGIPNYPEVVNQTLRLEWINVLAMLEYPHAAEALRAFLQSRPYGVTGLAAEMLLGEGDEMAIEHVRSLLADTDKHIRAEAALVLATWGRDPSAIPVLLEVYPEADRMLKIKILEALGRIGHVSTIPFLIERLKEPSMNVRIIAASVLIQSLNH